MVYQSLMVIQRQILLIHSLLFLSEWFVGNIIFLELICLHTVKWFQVLLFDV